MSNQERRSERSTIATCGIPVKDIPDLICVERTDFKSPEATQNIVSQGRDSYSHAEIFGSSCTLTEHIQCPLPVVYEYLANVFSMEEWTATVRQLEHVGGSLVRGVDMIAANTPIYLHIDANDTARTIDFLCAWDQGLDLWMRYFFRLFDASSVTNEPGTILLWTNFKHPYYERNSPAPDYITQSRNRTDRPWVGEFWNVFNVVHGMEARNIKKILEHRFRSTADVGRHAR